MRDKNIHNISVSDDIASVVCMDAQLLSYDLICIYVCMYTYIYMGASLTPVSREAYVHVLLV